MGMYHGESNTGSQDCQGRLDPISVHSCDIQSKLSSPDTNNNRWYARRVWSALQSGSMFHALLLVFAVVVSSCPEDPQV
jgi:hypothetical protein